MLAEALGGGIEVSSTPEQGSTFTLALPAGDLATALMCSAQELLVKMDSVEATGSSHWVFPVASVLVVDDAVENRALLSLVLRGLGLEVTLAVNGREAVDLIERQEFAVVLMDIQMPVMDGYEAVAAVRANGVTVPVVALTANAMKGYEEKIKRVGFPHYQTKPIDLDLLTRLLATLLGGVEKAGTDARRQSLSSDSGSDEIVPTMTLPETAVSTDPIVSSLALFNPRMKLIIERFLDKLDIQIKAMREGCEAQRWKELADEAHWLKGSGGTVGFDQLSEPARLLENAAKSENMNAAIEQIRHMDALWRRICSHKTEVSRSIQNEKTRDETKNASLGSEQVSGENCVTQTQDDLSKSTDSVDSPVISSLLS